MGANILGIGQTALSAAQAGVATTSHNIANAATPGYNRQQIVQSAALAQNFGYGFVGGGTQVADVRRVYNDFLNTQVLTAQSAKSSLDSNYAQIKQINNSFSDQTSGLAPAVQGFFTGLQAANANPSDPASRQSALSSAQTLVERFNSLSTQLSDQTKSVNEQVSASVGSINSYAKQIAVLNDTIGKQVSSTGVQPNDLLDARDQLIADLNTQVKTTVIKQDVGNYNIFIGNGQPLVIGSTPTTLVAQPVASDLTKLGVGYVSSGKTVTIADKSIEGGVLGGVLAFRDNTLDSTKNELGLIATTFAISTNEQNKLGLDLSGAPGANLFAVGSPLSTPNSANTSAAQVSATIVDITKLTSSNYQVAFDGSKYTVTRLSDGAISTSVALPKTVDGLSFNLVSSAPAAGDSFLVQPTAAGASGISLIATGADKLALAAPLRTAAPTTNTGTGVVSSPTVSTTYPSAPLLANTTFTYDQLTNKFTVSPAQAVTVTASGVVTTYPAGTNVDYTSGASITVGQASFSISASPATSDVFTLSLNTNGKGDNRNGLLISALQSKKTIANQSASFQDAYAKIVNAVGNQTHELDITSAAETVTLAGARAAQQSVSGVNLDEEAANLLRYQQAYQAAGKVMQTAGTLFDVLLSLGK